MLGVLLLKGVTLRFIFCFIVMFAAHMVDGSRAVARYKIQVTTAKDYLAGTSTKVFIDIIGADNQTTGPIELNNKGVDDFKRGATDTFYRNAKDVRPIKAIKLKRSVYPKVNPNWKVDKVVITVSGPESYKFYLGKWLREPNVWIRAYEENECRAGISKCDQLCINLVFGYKCGCHEGYQLESKYSCKDVDECTTGVHKCDLATSNCVNSPGSYSCQCKAGFAKRGNTCRDVDECSSGNHKCDMITSQCVNKPGSYSCHCKEGFVKVANTCRDVDECRTGSHKCDVTTSYCVNKPGGYSCYCKEGFGQTRDSRCRDMDECTTGAHKCDLTTSNCVNRPGSYSCQCKVGFVEVESNCRDVDECATEDHKCDVTTSQCVNKPGGYSCYCKEGFGQTEDGHCLANQCNSYEALGMESGQISNQSITASSYYTQYPPWNARLRAGSDKGWYALPTDYPSPWIQVDLGKPTWLKGIATQGKRFTLYVKTYKLAYSLDKVTWLTYHGNGQTDKVFNGNTDPYTVVTNKLDKPVYTRYVRIYPLTWNHAIVLKLELYRVLK